MKNNQVEKLVDPSKLRSSGFWVCAVVW